MIFKYKLLKQLDNNCIYLNFIILLFEQNWFSRYQTMAEKSDFIL